MGYCNFVSHDEINKMHISPSFICVFRYTGTTAYFVTFRVKQQLGYPDGARSFPRRFPRRRVLAQPRRLSSRAAVGRPMGIGRAELLVVVAPDRPRLRAEHLRARRTQSRPSPPPSFNSRARAPYLLPPVLATLANPNPNPTSAWRRTARSEFQSISGQFRSSALRSTSLPSSSHG
jgi:hypothetical protein